MDSHFKWVDKIQVGLVLLRNEFIEIQALNLFLQDFVCILITCNLLLRRDSLLRAQYFHWLFFYQELFHWQSSLNAVSCCWKDILFSYSSFEDFLACRFAMWQAKSRRKYCSSLKSSLDWLAIALHPILFDRNRIKRRWLLGKMHQ